MVRVHVALRIERGQKGELDDTERFLYTDRDVGADAWVASAAPPARTFVHEHGHIHADIEHLLLQDQVRLDDQGEVVVTSTVRLEGHPLHGLADHLHRAGSPGRLLHRVVERGVKQAHEVVDIYQDPRMRREFAEAVRHPQRMTSKQQRSLLFLVLLSAVWVWLVGLTVLAVVWPTLAVGWNLVFTLFFAALGTNLFVPIPVEPLVLASLGTVGTALAVLASGAGKAVGAWIIYSLGPTLRMGMARLEKRSPLTRRIMVRAEAFARRFGYAALGLMLAVPFSPLDIVPVYLFSGLGLRLGPFLAAVFLGFSLRLLMVVMLGEALFGL